MADQGYDGPLRKSGECRYVIPCDYKPGMHVPGVIYADGPLLEMLREDQSPEQVANVACLPGIVGMSLAMPDIHLGYGFAIGGVAAMDVENGVISPGGVGYDINCGVRVLTSTLDAEDVRQSVADVTEALFRKVPSGVGSEGKIKLSLAELRDVLAGGAAWAVKAGYGEPCDLAYCEDGGVMPSADPGAVSEKAMKRGDRQLGTLGSGNHFLEVSEVTDIYDEAAAAAYGLRPGRAVFQIHSGSRGLGHQVCTEYLSLMMQAVKKYAISLPDKQLACAPVNSPEGKQYFGAMAAAANYAWANRQVITHLVREAARSVYGKVTLDLLYDVAHNIAKMERHTVGQAHGQHARGDMAGANAETRLLCVHRKGATRAFGPGHPDIPEAYRAVGQPVLVPGDMGRSSYILAGTEAAMRQTFGSCCHGAGRVMSRASAKKEVHGRELQRQLLDRGITVRATSVAGLSEEAPEAYKDVSLVVDVAQRAGLARKVARLVPVGVIKG